MKYLLIAFGGALGALSRVLISEALYKATLFSIPFGIVSVNILGCFLVGLFFESLNSRLEALVILGFLGAFTTFSAFSKETLQLINDGEVFVAFLYVFISVGLCLLATWVGMHFAAKA